MKDHLGIARIALVPAIVQRFPGPGERHRRDKPDVEAGFDQAPRDGTVIVAGRLLGICSIFVKGREGQR